MTTNSLSVVANRRKLGEVVHSSGRLTFRYDPDWQTWQQAFPLSVSMPLPLAEHGHAVVESFLWGLLPDNQRVLDAWGRRFQVSSRNAFRLLEHVGEDCAGAIQFIQPKREYEVVGKNYSEQVDWITEDDLADRLGTVLQHHGEQRSSMDRGQFSLAGAQPKIALYLSPLDGRWGVPYGMTPTTHILKPAVKDFDGFAQNEHFCLTLAHKIGLPAARSSVLFADSIPTIAVKRYDRLFKNRQYVRVHQEDMCQAMSVSPEKKYQADGGPGITEVSDLIRTVSDDAYVDNLTFAKALIFNFLISGTDAHARNYSLILAPQSRIRLAPLYDLASSLPYPKTISPYKANMAMKIGGEYKIKVIKSRHWKTCATDLNIRWPTFKRLFEEITTQLIHFVPVVTQELNDSGLQCPIVDILHDELTNRANTMMDTL